jgi:hypothetical protein
MAIIRNDDWRQGCLSRKKKKMNKKKRKKKKMMMTIVIMSIGYSER